MTPVSKASKGLGGKMKCVEVAWIDSMLHEPEWQSVEDAIETATSDSPIQFTCGYLVYETEEHVLIALSRNNDGTRVSCVVTIPRRAILDTTGLSSRSLVAAKDPRVPSPTYPPLARTPAPKDKELLCEPKPPTES